MWLNKKFKLLYLSSSVYFWNVTFGCIKMSYVGVLELTWVRTRYQWPQPIGCAESYGLTVLKFSVQNLSRDDVVLDEPDQRRSTRPTGFSFNDAKIDFRQPRPNSSGHFAYIFLLFTQNIFIVRLFYDGLVRPECPKWIIEMISASKWSPSRHISPPV